ncbi:MAG: hypothetical protein QM754_05110 [Tepidisphaeraceae bacterium]
MSADSRFRTLSRTGPPTTVLTNNCWPVRLTSPCVMLASPMRAISARWRPRAAPSTGVSQITADFAEICARSVSIVSGVSIRTTCAPPSVNVWACGALICR